MNITVLTSSEDFMYCLFWYISYKETLAKALKFDDPTKYGTFLDLDQVSTFLR